MPAAPPPPAGVTIVPPATPPKPPPPPTREIKLGKDGGPPAPPPKPGSARDRLSQSLRAKAGVAEPAPAAAPAPHEPEPNAEPPAAPPESTPPAVTKPAATTPEVPGTKEKVNPWKLVDNYKGKIAALEKQLSEAGTVPQEKTKEYLTQIETLTKRNEELENEIRFVNYEKHPEFQEKYNKPYEAAWKRALSELSEITIADPETNTPRQATAQDLWQLLTVPLTKARELANQYFGDFADDIMGYRKEIKGLLDARQDALKQAKEAGANRDKAQQEIHSKHEQELSQFIKENWDKSVQAISTHEKYGRFVAPVEGDEDGNKRLEKGYALVDEALSQNPKDPRLSPEQRAAVIRKHASVRARAAAFGRLAATVQRLETEKAALEAELGQYRESTPPTSGGGTAPGAAPAGPTSASAQVFGALRKLAK